jgi:hypothetical protein
MLLASTQIATPICHLRLQEPVSDIYRKVMAAAVPSHHIAPIAADDYRDVYSFGDLAPGVRNWLVRALTQTWAFVTPPQSSLFTNRTYGQETWQPAPQSHDTIPLAQGNSGIVYVWVCVDQNNRIFCSPAPNHGIPTSVCFPPLEDETRR